MKNTILAIFGEPGIGKSTAINEIISRFPNRFPVDNVEIIHDGADRCVIFQIGNILIGMESAGDPGSRQPMSLQLFEERGCNIIIVASRIRGKTVTSIEALHQRSSYDIVWTSIYSCKEKPEDQSNGFFADHMLIIVSAILDGSY